MKNFTLTWFPEIRRSDKHGFVPRYTHGVIHQRTQHHKYCYHTSNNTGCWQIQSTDLEPGEKGFTSHKGTQQSIHEPSDLKTTPRKVYTEKHVSISKVKRRFVDESTPELHHLAKILRKYGPCVEVSDVAVWSRCNFRIEEMKDIHRLPWLLRACHCTFNGLKVLTYKLDAIWVLQTAKILQSSARFLYFALLPTASCPVSSEPLLQSFEISVKINFRHSMIFPMSKWTWWYACRRELWACPSLLYSEDERVKVGFLVMGQNLVVYFCKTVWKSAGTNQILLLIFKR